MYLTKFFAMKKYLFPVITGLFLACIWACGGESPEIKQEDSLRNEVFAIHDEVMPKMSDIVQLKGSLIELPTDSTNETEIKSAHNQLEKAEDAMMAWMNNFKAPEKLRDTQGHEEIMAYFENEKLEITKVRDLMNNSIANAKRILESGKQ